MIHTRIIELNYCFEIARRHGPWQRRPTGQMALPAPGETAWIAYRATPLIGRHPVSLPASIPINQQTEETP